MTLILPTRELVGLLADVHPFASKDDEDTIWHKVVVRYDGARLHAMAGDGIRLAHMSWGPDDGDQPSIPGFDPFGVADDPWELAILPENAKEIATKFKLPANLGDAPVRVDGTSDSLRIDRDADVAGVALTSSAMARPWDANAPIIGDAIDQFADQAKNAAPRSKVAYSGFALADFCNPKVVRQRGPVVLHFGRANSYIEIGAWFRGVVMQASEDA